MRCVYVDVKGVGSTPPSVAVGVVAVQVTNHADVADTLKIPPAP